MAEQPPCKRLVVSSILTSGSRGHDVKWLAHSVIGCSALTVIVSADEAVIRLSCGIGIRSSLTLAPNNWTQKDEHDHCP
jgi:hypothetical protein